MDDRPPPSAAELGISEVELERILRDMRRRGARPVSARPEPSYAAASRAAAVPRAVVVPAERPRRRLGWRGWLALAFAAVVLLPRLLGGDGDAEPEWTFLHSDGDRPITYSSCRPIKVAVFPAGGPPQAEQLVRDAIGELRAATGLDIVLTGSFGGAAPNWNFEAAPVDREDPISVSWQDGDAIAELTDDIAGLGGSRVTTNADGSQGLFGGTIALSRDYYRLLEERDDHDQQLAVLLHEFGHVLGLGHVDSSAELMSKDNTGQTGFGAGDLEGLRQIGQGACF